MANKTNKGISLVETLIYISILTLASVVVVGSLYSLGRSYRSMRGAEALERTAQVALERMVREVRDATSIDTALSLFNQVDGVLAINTTDDLGNSRALSFYVSEGVIRMEEDGSDHGPLSPESVNVSELIFRRIITPESEAVRIEMKIESESGGKVRVRKFYSTTVLRGSYLP